MQFGLKRAFGDRRQAAALLREATSHLLQDFFPADDTIAASRLIIFLLIALIGMVKRWALHRLLELALVVRGSHGAGSRNIVPSLLAILVQSLREVQ